MELTDSAQETSPITGLLLDHRRFQIEQDRANYSRTLVDGLNRLPEHL
jgi:hypothetical protein